MPPSPGSSLSPDPSPRTLLNNIRSLIVHNNWDTTTDSHPGAQHARIALLMELSKHDSSRGWWKTLGSEVKGSWALLEDAVHGLGWDWPKKEEDGRRGKWKGEGWFIRREEEDILDLRDIEEGWEESGGIGSHTHPIPLSRSPEPSLPTGSTANCGQNIESGREEATGRDSQARPIRLSLTPEPPHPATQPPPSLPPFPSHPVSPALPSHPQPRNAMYLPLRNQNDETESRSTTNGVVEQTVEVIQPSAAGPSSVRTSAPRKASPPVASGGRSSRQTTSSVAGNLDSRLDSALGGYPTRPARHHSSRYNPYPTRRSSPPILRRSPVPAPTSRNGFVPRDHPVLAGWRYFPQRTRQEAVAVYREWLDLGAEEEGLRVADRMGWFDTSCSLKLYDSGTHRLLYGWPTELSPSDHRTFLSLASANTDFDSPTISTFLHNRNTRQLSQILKIFWRDSWDRRSQPLFGPPGEQTVESWVAYVVAYFKYRHLPGKGLPLFPWGEPLDTRGACDACARPRGTRDHGRDCPMTLQGDKRKKRHVFVQTSEEECEVRKVEERSRGSDRGERGRDQGREWIRRGGARR